MKKITFFSFYLTLSLFCLFISTVYANEISAKDIELRIQQHVEAIYLEKSKSKNTRIHVSKPKIDSRIQINECNSELHLNILENKNSRNINVKISCLLPNPWKIYVPVKVSTLSPVLVSVNNLSKGTILDDKNTKIDYIEEHKVRGAILTDNKSVFGAKLKRNLQKGKPIYNNQVCVVCKGEMVTILADSSLFNIKTDGTALSNGTIGEQINVRNNRSGKIVSARVKSLNKVVINL